MTRIQISKPRPVLNIRDLNFKDCFGFRISHFEFACEAGLTIIELLVVIAIIIILAGLILSTVCSVQKKGARSRAEAEIAAISAALESYKSDNGIYPTNPDTAALDARTDTTAGTTYQTASQSLDEQLSGDNDLDGVPDPGAKSYRQFKPNQLGTDAASKPYLRDPFGNSYGYSTAYQANSSKGYNPTFDLWSVADANPLSNQ